MLTFCNSYVLWLLHCVQLRLVTVTFCDVNVVWCYVLSQYLVGHYLWDLGPKGGQGVMRLFIDLSLNFAPHEIILRITYNLLSWEARLPGTSGPSAFSQSWVILAVFWVARAQNPLSSWGQMIFFVLILDRSDICLPNILVLVQNCL
jgi:hypothetical protein